MAKKKSAARSSFVLVRTYSAGVHCGELVSRAGKEVSLRDARRVWRWSGANTLHELATKGPDDVQTRISEPVRGIVLTEAIEVIECSEAGAANLARSRWSK